MNTKYNEQIIYLLNKAYEYETRAYRSYVFAAVSTTGQLRDLYEELYKDFAAREAEHMYEIGEKITSYNGKVSTKCLPITEIEKAISNGYKSSLLVLQQLEQDTIDMYKIIHSFAQKIDDLPLVLLIEHIIQEEAEHYDELERILLREPKLEASKSRLNLLKNAGLL